MIEYELPLDENLEESFPAMKFDFPYIWFWGVVDDYIGGHVPWHWHNEPEFCHVLKGEIEYHLPKRMYVLSAGDGIFVNANVLHMIRPHNECKGAIMIAQVFHKLLLIGYHRCAIDNLYYRPIINSQNLSCRLLHHENPQEAELVTLLDDCYKCAEREEFGYQMDVRNYLSSLWLKLYLIVENSLNPNENAQNKNNTRLKQMMEFMNAHYAEKITLREIASAACISERECIRCFKKYMQMTPIQYLQEYRVDAAANMLLHSDRSITEIAMQNGFETSSYFSKTFKQFMQCTPKTYRDSSRQNYKPGYIVDKRVLDEDQKEQAE